MRRASEVLAETQPIAEAYERVADIDRVNHVITAAAKTKKAVAGLGRTLHAVHSDRVWQLIYAEDFQAPGYECGKCGGLFSVAKKSCQYCGGAVAAVPDIVGGPSSRRCEMGLKLRSSRVRRLLHSQSPEVSRHF